MRYKHIKTGNEYNLMFIANQGSTKPGFPEIAVYHSVKDGKVFARPLVEFEKKFEKFLGE